ncbi:OVARIAN TUMOR DOMAIN-containing deubiquitinating enzyme 12 [Punica granatum]|uniref:OVARIAN TUMOR DOMAIN-containing deubiquitinating enzyme 12 n=2 Tax=Punica granatum TaxID=22663 RepID=A0A6P8DS41_PUNGR|nr:OVARIAN TUMOR DOMAIN-containing deubiquitinating enzyme 12 [Punica granatum]XP_031397175.1 OVARIAN TUMOR DOMAIN-containing deubiquitinating enzyme 12 [Punica granatum]XP_031397176.1 OVARIAN TUMOR DOMAIN-containing deubiquitinating enzyme 12 [Punica granatum]XP_031397177.1 OVARIAN TUMOR DOMAIN-containing deubiquitinating enzyme 12 [Punica granatum]OWM82418.1 hypothetical protein CDL15_Pgr001992 [Punica granatum]PKI65139.1 hypothetical protein CRG98_014453 [Punica granatum]
MLEQDSDVFQWGQRLFDTPFFHPGYPTDAIHQDAGSIYHVPVNHYVTEYNTVENDEIIAHTLQEEFSHLAVRESSQDFHVPDDDSSMSVHQQDWRSPSMRLYYSGHNYDSERPDHTWGSGSPSSYGGEGYTYSEKPSDDNENSEFMNPLDQMVPIPHVPRINGEIPSTDEASSDYERLRQRLQLYDLVEHKVQGDGNCQFRALSDQLHQTPDYHESVREEIVKQLRNNSKFYEGYVPMEYDEYLSKMSRNGEWGDHVTLQAAADVYGAKILVITSFKDTCYIEIIPNNQKTKQVLLLSFWAEVHYNSIYPQGDMPSSSSGKKKRWWTFWG